MTNVFGEAYAAAYDALYESKDYAGECDLIERILAARGHAGPRRILDLGCGTGNHAIPLALRGHSLSGVDLSSAMLEQARRKSLIIAPSPGVAPPKFHCGDLCNIDLECHFDVVLMMFAVLGYQHTNASLLSALRAARRHLTPGGMFIFDVWNGMAVLTERPGKRVRSAATEDGHILRTSESQLDLARQLCLVNFTMQRVVGDRVVAEWKEEHAVRFFFPLEMELALECAGFRLLDLKRLPDGDGPPDEHAWSMIGVAQAQ